MPDRIPNLLPPYRVHYRMMTLAETKNYGHRLHNIPAAWKKSKGEGVKVAVLDTGLPVHRDLEVQIEDAENFTMDPITDIQGHSTHVSGIIAAAENNEGVIGVAPKSRLYIGKVLGDNGSGSDFEIADGIRWAINKGVDIINMSLGAPAQFEEYMQETKKAVIEAYEAGIVVICAAGNESADLVGFPARLEQAIAVAAVDSNEEKANFSNKGSALDFAAAGVRILSTYTNNTYAELSGTSMASPQIAGIAALVLSEHKNRDIPSSTPINNPEDLREHIRKISVDLGTQGHDTEFGDGLPVFGRINEPIIIVEPPPLPDPKPEPIPDPKPKPQPDPKPKPKPQPKPKPEPPKSIWNRVGKWLRGIFG